MMGICGFCKEMKNLTTHHIMRKSYQGDNNPINLIQDICRDCHDKLEENLNAGRALIGAGKGPEVKPSFQIGTIPFSLKTGSVLLDEKGKAIIDTDSPVYGMRMHSKVYGEKDLEATLSGAKCVVISGSLAEKNWIIYSIGVSQSS